MHRTITSKRKTFLVVREGRGGIFPWISAKQKILALPKQGLITVFCFHNNAIFNFCIAPDIHTKTINHLSYKRVQDSPMKVGGKAKKKSSLENGIMI